ncbi:hypothetical protein ACFE04_020446 [Oxalis oulophora]
MAKRGYKLQEFVAHSSTVNCVKIGNKGCRLLITGGDDHKVNLWEIGKPTSLLTLCGHTSAVHSLAFDSAQVLVLAGAASGATKLWDLEQAKIVRTLNGHRSNCTAVEFHPFGEFFASGSMDTHLRIWDIRKKGCIHTYRGHTQGVSTIKFSPDGRWVVSGGYDNVVKIWDLTAGKLLHDFKFHEGHIRSIDFHPLEFLLATGSADKTVKFWDLETFELIGTSRPEATGVRAITFHPDGRTLFSGSDDNLKVYSWEPVVRHDSVDIGWSTLGDLCIKEGNLIGCSYYQNSVGVWVADTSRIEPYGACPVRGENECTDAKFDLQGSPSEEHGPGSLRSTPSSRCISPDSEAKEIKNIYVDSTGGKPIPSRRVGSLNSPKIVLPEKSEENNLEKQRSAVGVHGKSNGQTDSNSFVIPTIIPQEGPIGKESISFSRTKPGMLLRPAHVHRPSNSKIDTEKLSEDVVSEDRARISTEEKDSNIKTVITDKLDKVQSPPKPPSNVNSDKFLNCNKETNSVKFVNGVVSGRTRSLVERFERREASSITEDQPSSTTTHVTVESNRTPQFDKEPASSVLLESDDANLQLDETPTSIVTPPHRLTSPLDKRLTNLQLDETTTAIVTPPHRLTSPLDKRLTNLQLDETTTSIVTPPHRVTPQLDKRPTSIASPAYHATPQLDKRPTSIVTPTNQITPQLHKKPTSLVNSADRVTIHLDKKPTSRVTRANHATQLDKIPISIFTPDGIFTPSRQVTPSIVIPEEDKRPVYHITPLDERPPVSVMLPGQDKQIELNEEPQISGRELPGGAQDVIEILMETHDVFTSTLRSRLTKLQMVSHFWKRKDMRGAFGALRKLSDHSCDLPELYVLMKQVHADVISVVMEKMEILTLDLFSCLLPVLIGLLDSKTDRHISMSLEMLLKLVAVFGPVVRSTISGPPLVGVDLQAEQRRECCNQCFIQLQRIQKMLAVLKRRGGVVSRCAHELNLVLEES